MGQNVKCVRFVYKRAKFESFVLHECFMFCTETNVTKPTLYVHKVVINQHIHNK